MPLFYFIFSFLLLNSIQNRENMIQLDDSIEKSAKMRKDVLFMDKKRYGERRDKRVNASARDRNNMRNKREDNNVSEEISENVVVGRNAVRELLKSGRDVDKIFVQRGEREGSIVVIVAEAVERKIPVVEVDKVKLDKMSGFTPHQGVVAMAAEKEYCTVEDILNIAAERGERPMIVISDGISDPHNLGALIRCAEGVGAHGIIIPKRRAVGLTAVVAKASAGAIEHMAIAKVPNIAACVEELKEKGIWVFAAEAGGDAYYNTDFKCPCALVFGSEGDGVSKLVKDRSDYIVSIPMYGKVNSFNVSTAAAIILAEVSRQHREG